MENSLKSILETLHEEKAGKMLTHEEELDMEYLLKDEDLDNKQLNSLLQYTKLLYDLGEYEGKAKTMNRIYEVTLFHRKRIREQRKSNYGIMGTTKWPYCIKSKRKILPRFPQT